MSKAIPPLASEKLRLCLLCGQYVNQYTKQWNDHRELCEKIYIEARPWLKEHLEKEVQDEVLKRFKKNIN